MNKKIIIGVLTLIVIVAGASILTPRGGPKGSYYDGNSRGNSGNSGNSRSSSQPGSGRGGFPQGYSDEPTLSTISAELLPVNDNITRVELAYLIYEAIHYNSSLYSPGVPLGCFKDSKMMQYKNYEENQIGEIAICKLASKNIMGGYSDGTFKPFGYVNRAEAAKIFQAAFSPTFASPAGDSKAYYADVPNNSWFYPYVAWLVNAKVADIVSSPTNYFYPATLLTHGRALYWINNVKKNVPKSKWDK